MINYYKYFFLLKRYLQLFNRKFIFNTLINLLFLTSIVFCLSVIILTTSINEGFKQGIQKKIINIDGHTRFYKKNNFPLDESDYSILSKKILDKYSDINISKIISSQAILKTPNGSEGVLINSIDSNGVDVFSLNNYIVSGSFNDKSIIIGSMLASKFSIKVNDSVFVINLNNNSVIPVNISGIFRTNIPNYDKHTIYSNIDFFREFLGYNKKDFESLVVNTRNNEFIADDLIFTEDFDYYLITWKDRFSSFLLWLFSYDIPIRLLLLFILIISILNIGSSIYLDILLNKRNNAILYILGLKNKDFKIIYLFKNLYIFFVGCLFSYFLIKIFIYAQLSYEIISIPKQIYMLNNISIDFNVTYFLYLILFLFISVISISVFCVHFIFKFENPAKLVKK